eukprot:gene10746-17822_t
MSRTCATLDTAGMTAVHSGQLTDCVVLGRVDEAHARTQTQHRLEEVGRTPRREDVDRSQFEEGSRVLSAVRRSLYGRFQTSSEISRFKKLAARKDQSGQRGGVEDAVAKVAGEVSGQIQDNETHMWGAFTQFMGVSQSTADTLGAATRREFYKIADSFQTREEVTAALRQQGLESSNLIVAVDFTKSNEWTGKISNRGKCLHTAPYTGGVSPYEEVMTVIGKTLVVLDDDNLIPCYGFGDVMTVIGKTLAEFDDDNLIPCYGFGDISTADKGLFSFLPNDEPCVGMEAAVQRYKEVASDVRLSGPTSFAPAICQAMKAMKAMKVTSNGKTGALATVQEAATIKSIVAASELPLSIIMVGVGDGPWDMMETFDDLLPQRKFDNFQFVNYTKLALRFANDPVKRDVNFAKDALMEIPEQFKIIQTSGLLSRTTNITPPLIVHPINPPQTSLPNATYSAASSNVSRATFSTLPSFQYPAIASASGLAHAPSFHEPPSAPPAHPQPHTFQAPPPDPAQHHPFQAPTPHPFPIPTAPASSSAVAGGAQPNDLFLCPISQEVMADPVIASDGYTYDRKGIEQWLNLKQTSPMTNTPMPSTALVPNHRLRSSIMEWQQVVGAIEPAADWVRFA